ncbi:cation transport protein-domain-containing protein [Radiomyces spectabilis]|uniref:cation transport protein-domain-containing protein n=1 Tax=Radiomyces spectabilis TaxID=64574 RepID=UPI002220BA96|nr:cation transport protein-domain-containing protein [Radiomyces spectabilis]KAI8391833.1 cation transport protein-domain-containing protein [Radiomyces spectabilis]
MNRYRPNSYFDDAASGRLSMIRLKRLPTISSVMTTGRKVLKRPDFFVMTQIQRQLTSEICWLLVSIFAICVIEADAIMSSGSPITTASVIYECVSAFGNVGASLGYPDSSLSQVGHYHKFSKFVVILLMYRGRHRGWFKDLTLVVFFPTHLDSSYVQPCLGLPAAIDRAVLLPSEQLEQKEVHDNIFRRRNTMASTSPSVMFYDKSRF